MNGNTATTNANDGGNVATFTSNEHGLNFLSESEVETKPQTVVEPPAPVEQNERAPPENTGFGASGADQGWVAQGGDGTAVDHEGNDTGELLKTTCYL